jgi:hypothetical protein
MRALEGFLPLRVMILLEYVSSINLLRQCGWLKDCGEADSIKRRGIQPPGGVSKRIGSINVDPKDNLV